MRPAGSVWRMRLSWDGDGEPGLEDLVWEHPEEVRRGYLVVGVEEPSRAGARWIVLLERLKWDDFERRLLAVEAGDDGRTPAWSFIRDRR